MKRFWITVLCVLTLLGAVVGIAQAETATFEWEITGGTLYIRGTGDMPYYSSGTAPWFERRAEFTSIVVEEGITGLSDYCFVGCDGVTAVYLPKSLTRLAASAFASCISLEEITIPEGITALPDQLFRNCEKLKTVNLPQGLTTLGAEVFEYCTALQTIDLPQSVTAIGKDAFTGSGIRSIDLPDNITHLEKTFRFCDDLKEVTLPENLKSTYYVFEECPKLTELVFPAGITSVGWYTLHNCTGMQRIIFTGDLPEIDLNAFDIDTCEVYYPLNNATWHDVYKLKNYGIEEATYYAADADNICASHTPGKTQYFYIPNSCMYYGANAVTCQNCSALRLESLPPHGHAYVTRMEPAGADTNGYTFHFCAYCNWQYYTFPDPQNLTYQDALLILKDTMVQRHPKISFRFLSDVNFTDSQLEAMYQEALENDGDPMHGDYMAVHTWHHTLRSTASSAGNGQYWISVTFEFLYHSTETEEMYVNDWLVEILEELELDGKTDFEKIRTIHDWIVHRLNYDYTFSRYFPYDALRDNVGVCEAYALLTYRLMLTAGIDCRMITGNRDEPPGHGWNIVKLDGVYYQLDCTWDDPGNGGMENYDYFLLGTDHFFADHTPDPEFNTEAFYAKYPCAKEDYCANLGNAGDGTYWILKDGTLVFEGEGPVTCKSYELPYVGVTCVRITEGITALPSNIFFELSDLEMLIFEGDKPQMSGLGLFYDLPPAYYPANNSTWAGIEADTQALWKPYLDMGLWGNNIYWLYFADRSLEFFGAGPMQDTFYLPPWVEKYRNSAEKAVFHEGITYLCEDAFSSCSALTHVTLPETLISIGEAAFRNCQRLTEITLPAGLTTIGDSAFSGCSALERITFPENLELLDKWAFSYCSNLKEVTFPGAAPTIEVGCFQSVQDVNVYYYPQKPGWEAVAGLHYGGYLIWIPLEAIRLGALSDITAFLDTPVEVTLEAVGENLHFAWYLDGEKLGGDENPLLLQPEMAMDSKELYCVVTDEKGNSATSNRVMLRVYDRLLLGVPKELRPGEAETYSICFTPEKRCVYRFTATGSGDVFGVLYQMDGGYLAISQFTDDGFTLEYTLEGGKTYLLQLQTNSAEGLDPEFFLTATKVHGTTGREILEAATCSTPGQAKDTCTLCGESWVVAYAVGHQYVNGTCTFCGKAEPTACGQLADNLWWEFAGDTLRVYGIGAMPDFEAAAQQPWYAYHFDIRNVILETGVTWVGKMSFLFCTSLEQVSLPQTLTGIGGSAFSHCVCLTAVELPQGLQKLGLNSFYYTDLRELVIPANVTNIDSGAFANCSNLKTITFLGAAPTMATDAFENTYAEASHPANDPTWTDGVKNAHPTLTWKTEAVSGGIRGDLDCNGTVDAEDVILLLLHLTMPDLFQLTPGVDGDLTGDGFVTVDDAIHLLLHITMPDLFPL